MNDLERHERARRFDAVIRSISRRIRLEAQPFFESLGLSWPRLLVMIAARRNPGLPMGDVAKRLGLSRSAATTLVDELVRQGFVSRSHDADDRRVVRVHLLPAGQEALEKALERRRAIVERALGDMSGDQLEGVIAALENVDNRLRSEKAPER